ncbi:BatD family protein [Pseudomonas sp. ZM23]|uniref:BatD family protein n=1 Tax=Pseudomonas triclosanedens TaxID=2961893 RepID=A0ABY6ZVF5_9PSED|nr:BatD family protein [Pseudomonas triclosanedens]MCP8466629.1 BatD family protein [Pseudomonas triclosanedens]MCP8472016.1 BatD family protein [Pseudomonas triclosanedens]MCP8474600.1 BatD family protein [Pseudomonas triclosanedens]WAI48025.1 BatD family protein [Pseudomonas triclosanedens]
MKRLICLTLLCLAAVQAEASFTASVDRTRLNEGESIDLTLESDDPTLFGKPDLTPLDAQFMVLGTRQVNRLTTLNGKTQATTRWIVTLQPRSEGIVEIPPIHLGGSASEPISLHVLKAEESTGEQKLAPVFIDASVDHEEGYVQAQVILTLRIYHSVSLYDDSSLTPLQMADARVEPLGEPRTYEKEINGVRHGVIEMRYAIFPQKSGTLEIPGQTFNATQVAQQRNQTYNPFGPQPGKQIRVISPSIPLEIKPKPADYPANAPWLPARALSLSETWSPQPEQAREGEALTRNIMLRVEGLSSAQLPPLPQTLPGELRHYPDQPQLANQSTEQGVIGSREEREALIADHAGQVQLPAIEVVWWNTRENRVERTSLPARTLEVAANPQLEASGETPGTPSGHSQTQEPARLWAWQLACAILAFTTLLGFGLWWRARRLPAVIRAAVAGPSARTLLDELRRACQANDPHATRQALDAWARQQPETLADMAARFVPLSDAMDSLNGALYSDSEGGRNWQGEDLWRAIRTLPGADPEAAPAAEPSSLPPLYPR